MFASPTLFILYLPALLSLVAEAAPGHAHEKRHGYGGYRHGNRPVVVEEVVVVKTVMGAPPGPSSAAPHFQGGQFFEEGDGNGVNPAFGVKKYQKPDYAGTPADIVPVNDDPPASASGTSPPVQTGGGTSQQSSGGQSTCSNLGSAPAMTGQLQDVAAWYINYHRCNHTDTGAVNPRKDLVDSAQNCANQCLPHGKDANGKDQSPHCLDKPTNGERTGQVIAFPKTNNPAGLVNSIQVWYYGDPENAIDNWNTLFTSSGERTGFDTSNSHLAILIGKTHTDFGCALANCGSEVYSVCNFAGKGQADGFGTPQGKPSIDDGDWMSDGQVPAGTQG